MKRFLVLPTVIAALLAAAPAASAAPANPPLGGTVTITGSNGRDDLEISLTTQNRILTIEPAATVTATSGSCAPDNDPQTGRPVRNSCGVGPGGLSAVIVDLRGGDDAVVVNDQGLSNSLTALGGIGNDAIELGTLGARTLRGGDGDDVLGAPGSSGSSGVTFDGGAGRDQAAFGAPTRFGNPLGVAASLETGQASLSGFNLQTPPTYGVQRTDTLTAIERLSGTPLGDVLTGGAGADELLGGDGPDNLRGGAGTDSLGGGQGLDDLVGGAGADTLDGGTEIDTYPKGDGFDTYQTRDGFEEAVICTKSDIVVDDLVDIVKDPTNCQSITTAQAKHKRDTVIKGRKLGIGADGTVRARMSCPARKNSTCAGTVLAKLGKDVLGGTRYRLPPGKAATLLLRFSKGAASRARGREITLDAKEVDGDGRDRRITKRLSAVRR